MSDHQNTQLKCGLIIMFVVFKLNQVKIGPSVRKISMRNFDSRKNTFFRGHILCPQMSLKLQEKLNVFSRGVDM